MAAGTQMDIYDTASNTHDDGPVYDMGTNLQARDGPIYDQGSQGGGGPTYDVGSNVQETALNDIYSLADKDGSQEDLYDTADHEFANQGSFVNAPDPDALYAMATQDLTGDHTYDVGSTLPRNLKMTISDGGATYDTADGAGAGPSQYHAGEVYDTADGVEAGGRGRSNTEEESQYALADDFNEKVNRQGSRLQPRGTDWGLEDTYAVADNDASDDEGNQGQETRPVSDYGLASPDTLTGKLGSSGFVMPRTVAFLSMKRGNDNGDGTYEGNSEFGRGLPSFSSNSTSVRTDAADSIRSGKANPPTYAVVHKKGPTGLRHPSGAEELFRAATILRKSSLEVARKSSLSTMPDRDDLFLERDEAPQSNDAGYLETPENNNGYLDSPPHPDAQVRA